MILDDILKAKPNALVKVLLFSAVVVLALSPGAILLLLENCSGLLNANWTVQLGLSLVLSIPLHFLGTLTYLHPYSTLKELNRMSPGQFVWTLVLGIGLWSTLSSVILYALVHGANELLVKHFTSNIKVHYAIAYFFVLTPFASIFWVNSSRFKQNVALASANNGGNFHHAKI